MDATLISALERIVGADHLICDAAEMATYETDGLAKLRQTPGLVVLPGSAEEVRRVVQRCHEAGVPFVARGQGTGSVRGGDAAPGRRVDRHDPPQPHSRRRHPQPADHRRAGHHEPRRDQGRGWTGLLLRARSVQPGDLLHRRERGGEFRWGSLPQVRLHRASRARRRGGAARRGDGLDRRGDARYTGAGPAGGHRRVRGDAGRGDERDAPAPAQAGRRQDAARGVRVHRGRGGTRSAASLGPGSSRPPSR